MLLFQLNSGSDSDEPEQVGRFDTFNILHYTRSKSKPEPKKQSVSFNYVITFTVNHNS